jgi:CPA2 family monovalent cation:H+ antiporter-2
MDMATETEMIMAVVIVLVCAIAVLFIGKRFRVPLIVGYFLTGIIVGPFGLGLVTEDQVSLLADLGVILLMFTIGLEIPLKELIAMKKIVLIGGGLQLILTTAVVWAIMTACGFASNAAIFIGFLVAHSSTAIIMNIYQRTGEIDTQHGKISLGMLIFQDLNVVPMMMLVPILAGTTGTNLIGSIINFGIGMCALVVILAAAIYLVPKFLQRVALTRSSELFIIAVVVICFGIAWIMSLTGVSLALGAFLAGVAISGSDYSHEVIGQIMPIRDLLTSFFFVSIGMMLNLMYLGEHLILILALAAALMLGKTLVNFVSVKILGVATGAALLSAIGLSQIGEFSFILGETGLSSGILTESVYQVFLAISIVTMAITPFAVSTGPKIVKRFIIPTVPQCQDMDSVSVQTGEEKKQGHVIIVGYGLVGSFVVKALRKVDIPYIILELNADTVEKEKKRGENIVYCDASHESVLEYAGIHKAQTIVISIPQIESIKAIISVARRLNPKIGIITRSRFISETGDLYHLGADEVVVDEKEVAIQIFRRILSNQQVPVQDLELYTKQARNEVYDKYLEKPIISNIKYEPKYGIFDSLRLRAKWADDKLSKNQTSVEQIRVGKGSDIAGKSLSEIHLRMSYGVSVIAVKRAGGEEAIVSPDGNTILEVGDTAVVIGERSSITKMTTLFMEKTE